MLIFVINTLVYSFCFIGAVDSRVNPVKGRSFEGDISMSRQEMNKIQTEIMFTGKVHPIKIWPNGKIPFVISNKFDRKHQELMLGAMLDISGDTCIHFVPKQKEDVDYIEFVFSEFNKCSSKVGRVGKRQEILMSPSCMRHGTVVHELLHALGFFHEQSRPDRDKFVTIMWDNLKSPDSKRNFELYGTKFWTEHKMPYDYASIMHYSSEAFSKQWGKKTILPKTANAPIGQRNSMSHFDKEKINIMYNCPIED